MAVTDLGRADIEFERSIWVYSLQVGVPAQAKPAIEAKPAEPKKRSSLRINNMKYTNLILVGLMVAFGPLTSATAEDADTTMQKVKTAIAAYKRSDHLCPSVEYGKLNYEAYCKQWCDRGMTCHGSRATDPCAATSNSDECQQFAKGAASCLKEMNEKNIYLIEYDAILKECHTKKGAHNGQHNTSNDTTSNS